MKKIFMEDEKVWMLHLLEQEIESTVSILALTSDEESRDILIKQLNDLTKVRNDLMNDGKIMKGFDWGVLVSSVLGLVGIGAMLKFERTDVITTKALPSILKWIGK